MGLDSGGGDEALSCNLLVREAFGNEAENLAFTIRERDLLDRGPGCGEVQQNRGRGGGVELHYVGGREGWYRIIKDDDTEMVGY